MRFFSLKTFIAAALLAPATAVLFAQETTPENTPEPATQPAPATASETLTFKHLSPKVVADSVKMFTARFGAAGMLTATVSEDGKNLVVQGRPDAIAQLKAGIARIDIEGGDAMLTMMAQRFSAGNTGRPRFGRGGFTGTGDNVPASGTTPAAGMPEQPAAERTPSHQAAVAPAEERVGPIILVDESLPQVIALLEKFSGKSVLRTQTLPQLKINFTGTEKLTREKAILALESLLAINGVSIIPQGDDFLKATPAVKASLESPPLYLDSVAKMPPSERIIARLFTLSHTTAQIVEPVLKPLANTERGGSVIAMPTSNAVLFTDSVASVLQAEKIVASLDAPNSVMFFPLKNVRAGVVKKQLETLQKGGLKSILPGDIAVEADDTTNQIMIVTTRQNEAKMREIITRMDSENTINTAGEVIPLKHVDVTTAFSILEGFGTRKASSPSNTGTTAQRVTSAGSSSGGGTGTAQQTNPFKTYSFSTRAQIAGTGAPDNNRPYYYQPPQQNKTPESEMPGTFSEYLSVAADERSNSLIVIGTPSDIRQIKDIVAKIDVELAQVRIEAVIVEVTLADQAASGLSTLGLGYMTSPSAGAVIANGDYKFNTSTPNLPNGKAPFAITGSIKDLSLDMVFNEAEHNTHVRVLSAPLISTSHNKNAHIVVSTQQPIITNTQTDLSNNGTQNQSVEYKNIGLELTVTPRVGANGSVELDVLQKIQSIVGKTVVNNNEQPIISNREAVSYLTAKHNETIVLAGLQSYRESTSDGKVWLLGDIPLLGELFKPETKDNERTEIIIVLKPHVIEPGNAKEEFEKSPGLLPGALTAPDAKNFLETGRFGALSLTQDEHDALEKLREKQRTQAAGQREQQEDTATGEKK